MKSDIVTRLYAIALSAVFASLATLGVAVLMTSTGDDGWAAASASAAASRAAPPAKAELTKWEGPVTGASKQVL